MQRYLSVSSVLNSCLFWKEFQALEEVCSFRPLLFKTVMLLIICVHSCERGNFQNFTWFGVRFSKTKQKNRNGIKRVRDIFLNKAEIDNS